jgi:hypothetical protein
MPITITITDGTVTATDIVLPDNRTRVTAAALSAAVGDSAPPANDARAIRAAVAQWIGTTRRQHRQATVTRSAENALRTTLDNIAADEETARP